MTDNYLNRYLLSKGAKDSNTGTVASSTSIGQWTESEEFVTRKEESQHMVDEIFHPDFGLASTVRFVLRQASERGSARERERERDSERQNRRI